ncbi:MAG: LpxI family protein [Candidatus Omnitrophica bacterium]|nr:LpxI family protein [Candidatus Omnitrophota bacterium]
MENVDRIALIAGSGKFPLFLANATKANGLQVVVIAVNSETDPAIEKLADKVYWLNLGEGAKLIETLQAEGIRYAMMAGKISKTTLFKEGLKLDEEAKKIMSRVIDRKDDTLLSAVASRLKDFDIELLDSTTFLKAMMPAKGLLTSRKPTAQEAEDVKFGFKIAKEMGRLDIGQSVVVKKKAVIAIEAIEGTDEAIKRAGSLIGKDTVVIKVSKPQQDMRFDVPVVGLTTIESLHEAGASVLAIEAGKVLVLEKDEVARAADRYGITIVAV